MRHWLSRVSANKSPKILLFNILYSCPPPWLHGPIFLFQRKMRRGLSRVSANPFYNLCSSNSSYRAAYCFLQHTTEIVEQAYVLRDSGVRFFTATRFWLCYKFVNFGQYFELFRIFSPNTQQVLPQPFNPFLFIRGLSSPRSVQTSLTQNCF